MRKAEPLAGLGGLALLVSLFLPWYRPDVVVQLVQGAENEFVGQPTETGWEALAVTDVILAVLALLALAVPIVTLVTKGPAKSIGTAVLASAFGWIAILLVALELLRGDLEYGIWVAFVASIVAWVGSWLSLRDESTPGAGPPNVPRLPAP